MFVGDLQVEAEDEECPNEDGEEDDEDGDEA